jgi:hypothetical protein
MQIFCAAQKMGSGCSPHERSDMRRDPVSATPHPGYTLIGQDGGRVADKSLSL